MELANKLILVLGAAIVLVLGTTGGLWIQREVRLHEDGAREDLVIMGRAIRPALVQTWRAEGPRAALEMLDYADERFRALREVTIRFVSFDAAPAGILEPLQRGEPVSIGADGPEGEVAAWIPVHSPGVPPGALELRRSLDGERAFHLRSLRDGLAALALVLVILTIATLTLTRWLVGRPLRRLADQARRIGRGEFSVRLGAGSQGDVGVVAAEMDEMCDRLVETRERVAAEHAQSLAATEQLRHADRLATVGQLAAGVAHELGTPLNVMVWRAKLISSGEHRGDAARDGARIIAEQGERVVRIIRQLLGFARRKVSPKVRTGLAPIVHQTLTMLEPLAKKRGVTLRFEAREPPGEALVEVNQVEQALTNLVINGVQSMPEGGTVTVDLQRERVRPPPDLGGVEGDFLRLEVRDQGAGIAAGNLPHVFDPFFTTKAVGEGTGLGLSVAWGIARDHGGWIDVASAPGEGSQFVVHIPLAGSPGALLPPAVEHPQPHPQGGLT